MKTLPKLSILFFICLLLAGGCVFSEESSTTSTKSKANSKVNKTQVQLQNQPQSLEVKTVNIGKHTLQLEVADSPKEISIGMMYRTEQLKPNKGMLFVFSDEAPRVFWMKNTFIPLSIGFFDKNKKLIHFVDMQPVRSEMETPKTYSSQRPAQYVVELPPGWFEKNKVNKGAKLGL